MRSRRHVPLLVAAACAALLPVLVLGTGEVQLVTLVLIVALSLLLHRARPARV